MSNSFDTEPLKLIALDTDDLAVISAQLQDAVVRIGDLAYLPNAHRFAAVLNRFNWMAALQGGGAGAGKTFERRQTALRFEKVRSAQLQNIDLGDKRRVLSLLAIRFVPSAADAPDGAIDLLFAAGAAIRLSVECIECELRDLGAAWATSQKPSHPDEAGQGGFDAG